MTILTSAGEDGEGAAKGPQGHLDRFRLHQIRHLVRQSPMIAAGNFVNSALTVGIFWDRIPHALLLGWLAALWLVGLVPLRTWWRGRRQRPPSHASKAAVQKAVLWAAVAGILWGGGGAILWPDGSEFHQLFLTFVIGGMAAAAVASLSALRAACLSFVILALAPIVGRYASLWDERGLAMAMMLGLYLAALVFFACNGYESFASNLRNKRVKEQLLIEVKRAKTMLSEALESASDGFTIFDANDRLQLCNVRFREIYSLCADIIKPGRTFEEILRVGLERGQYADTAGREEAWLAERLAAHRGMVGCVEQKLADGRWLLIQERRMSTGAIVGVWTDVTALKKREDELRRARDDAESANRAKSRFFAMMSHELRTPLNAVIGFSEMMSSQRLGPLGDPKYVEYANDIGDSGQHLLALINDILDLSKAEAGKLDLNESVIDLGAVVQACITLAVDPLEKTDVSLIEHIDADLPPIRADERMLKQILVNLLSNAIKFTPAGGTVTLSAARDDRGGVAVSVADTGIGISPADIETALAPFGQVDHGQVGGGAAHRLAGTGLGLSLSKSLTELHGGALELESAPEAGTTVTLRLPRERLLEEAEQSRPAVG